MEEISSLWSYQEAMDEMKQKLLYTTLEMQRLKAESRESKEHVKQLVELVKNACKERDEARNEIQKILSSFSHHHHVQPGRANSGLTESNSFSDSQNYHYGSPPVDPVSSPELSSINSKANMVFVSHQQPLVLDQGALVIDSLVKGKILPEKGKLLNAVLEAGPLLQTVLLAGPLPRWRNPPQIKHFLTPPVSPPNVTHNLGTSQPYFEMSCGSSNMLSSSMLDFGSVPYSGSNIDGYGYSGKRQRLH